MSFSWGNAGIAQLVERELPKLEVASSNLVARSTEDAACAVWLPMYSRPLISGVPVAHTEVRKWALPAFFYG